MIPHGLYWDSELLFANEKGHLAMAWEFAGAP